MNELRGEILWRRLEHLLQELPTAGAGRRDSVIAELALIWRDLHQGGPLAVVS